MGEPNCSTYCRSLRYVLFGSAIRTCIILPKTYCNTLYCGKICVTMLFIDTHCRFQELFNAPVGGNVTSLQQSAEIIHVNKNVTMVQTTFNSPAHLFLYSVSHAALGSKKYDTHSHLLLTQAHIHTSHHKSYTNIQ